MFVSHNLVVFEGVSNVYGSPIVALAGAPLTTLSAMSNGAIHFAGKSLASAILSSERLFVAPPATILNASQLTQSYATTLANGGTTLITAGNSTPSSLSLSALQQHAHPHAAASSPYILLSTSSDEVCANGDVTNGVLTGKSATLPASSGLYFYNHNSTPTMYPTDFLRL